MDVFGRQDQVLRGGLSSDAMFMSWPQLAAVGGGGVGMLVQNLGIDYSQPIRRIFEIGPGVIPTLGPGGTPDGGSIPATGCDTAEDSMTSRCLRRTQPTYYIIGRPEGRFQMGRFVGPQVIGECFIRTYGSACAPNIMSLTGKAGCSATDPSAKRMTWLMSGVVINNLSMNVTAQEMIIQESLSAMFAGLNLSINGSDDLCNPQLVSM
jgi:hypothetical protein